MRAQWHEVEDGVLWQARVGRRDRGRGCRRLAGRSRRSRTRRRPARGQRRARRTRLRTSSRSARQRPGHRLTYTLLRLGSQQVLDVSLAPSPRGSSMYYVLAAVGLFTLLVGASVRLRRPARSGDTAFLLAVRRVLRRLYVLVQRSVRSARLGVLLGRRRRAGAAAAAAARTSRWCFPQRPLRAQAAADGAASCRCVYLPALVARRGARRRGHRAARPTAGVFARASTSSIARSHVYLFVCALAALVVLVRSFRQITSVTGAAAASLDRLGHGARRRPVCLRLRAAVGARHRSAARAAVDGDSAGLRAADLRLARSSAIGCATSK